MIYFGALFALTALAVLNRAARPYAFALLFIWGLTWALEDFGLGYLTSLSDGVGFSLIAMLNWSRKTWWTQACLSISIGTIAIHGVAWMTYYTFGLWYGYEYADALRTLFLIQMLVLVWGGYDVVQRMADFVSRHGNVHGLLAGHRGFARRPSAASSEKVG